MACWAKRHCQQSFDLYEAEVWLPYPDQSGEGSVLGAGSERSRRSDSKRGLEFGSSASGALHVPSAAHSQLRERPRSPMAKLILRPILR